MAGRDVLGSATNCSSETTAENIELMTRPDRITVTVSDRPLMRESSPTRMTATMPQRNTMAISGNPQMPSMIASAPPKAAPWEMPSMSGETSGFRNTP